MKKIILNILLITIFTSISAQTNSDFKTIDDVVSSTYKILSGPAGERDWDTFKSGMPRLNGAIGCMDCTVTEHRQFSSHTLFVGIVNEGSGDEDLSPLLYFRGKFGELASE